MWKKIGIALAAIAIVVIAVLALFGDRLLLKAMQRVVESNVGGAYFDALPDGLHLMLCGSGSPMPDPTRAGPCVAVVAGKRLMIVDVGSGGVRNLAPRGLPVGRVEDVFITHFHSDHIDGLGELMLQRWAGGSRETPTPVHGPSGIEQVVEGFNLAYRHDFGYRIGHHGPDVIPPGGAGGVARPFELPQPGQSVTLIDDNGLKVIAFSVEHPPISPAVGYRFDYKGRSLLISGDTVKSANLTQFAQGVDLLVHEALAPELVDVIAAGARQVGADDTAQIMDDIHNYHVTPVQAAEVAEAAGARHLLYYHIVPALPLRRLETLFVRGVAEAYRGDFTVGRDGTWVSLPAGSTDVDVSER